jgi:hypothetical protein
MRAPASEPPRSPAPQREAVAVEIGAGDLALWGRSGCGWSGEDAIHFSCIKPRRFRGHGEERGRAIERGSRPYSSLGRRPYWSSQR